jgi:hypothetical protein
MLRKLLPLALVLVLFAGVGCDSNDDDDLTQAELFVGTWGVTRVVNDSGGANEQDISPVLIGAQGTLQGLSLTFNADNTYSLNADYRDPATPDVVIAGAPFTYSVNEANSVLTLNLPSPTGAGTIPAQIGFSFNGDREMTALLPALIMNTLFTTNIYQGNVAATFQKQ